MNGDLKQRCRFHSERNDSTALRLLIREIEQTTTDAGIKTLVSRRNKKLKSSLYFPQKGSHQGWL